MMRELSVTEQRYQAVLAVISDGETVSGVAATYGVHRKTVRVKRSSAPQRRPTVTASVTDQPNRVGHPSTGCGQPYERLVVHAQPPRRDELPASVVAARLSDVSWKDVAAARVGRRRKGWSRCE